MTHPQATPVPTPGVAALPPYRSSRPTAPMRLYVDGNEGTPPGPEILEVLQGALAGALGRYPDPGPLTERLAERLGIEPARVLVTAGADDAIDRFFRAFLMPGRRVVYPVPIFAMIRSFARVVRAEIAEIPWPEGPLPADALLAAGSDATAIVVVSPNNPTGAVATADELVRIAQTLSSTLLLLDMAYIEFADEDPTHRLLALPNVVMVRTLSKAWGLAGARVGYAIATPPIIDWMRTAGSPYAVAQPSLLIAEAWLSRGEAVMQASVAQVKRERLALAERLRALGGAPLPSQGNFVLARVPDAVWTQQALRGLGIAIRRFPQLDGGHDLIRVSCPGRPADFELLCGGLQAAMAPQALLFDVDGVLADVSRSYRQAIIDTVASYGIELEPNEIEATKAAGGANNDWCVTRRLLAAHGVEVSLGEATTRFEARYQGDAGHPGLRERECLIPEVALLEALASRVPLAVVTGRPRADLEDFFGRTGVGRLFSTVICMEDAPAKPDPAPVRLALKRLGVRSAWLIGDTPDDICAARDAGVVPLGILAPGADPTTMRSALAGAARVLSRLDELLDLLEVIS